LGFTEATDTGDQGVLIVSGRRAGAATSRSLAASRSRCYSRALAARLVPLYSINGGLEIEGAYL